MRDRGGKWWGHIGWVAQPLDDTLASVVLTQGTAQMCWGQARQDTLGPEQEEQLQAEPRDAGLRSEPGKPGLWLKQRLGGAGTDTAPPPEGQRHTLGFHHSTWPGLITGLSPSLAIREWTNRPGDLRELSSSGLGSPNLPLRGWCWPGDASASHSHSCTILHTSVHTRAYNLTTLQPMHSIKFPALRWGGGGE